MAVFRCVDCGELVYGEEVNFTSPCIRCDRCNRSKPSDQGPATWEHGLSFIDSNEKVSGFSFIDSDGKVRNFAVVKRLTEDPRE